MPTTGKRYLLTADAVRRQKNINRTVEGGFRRRRPTQKRRRFVFGTSDTTAPVVLGMLTQSVNAFSAIDGTAKTATPGYLADGVTLIDFKRDANGDYVMPPRDFEAIQEDDGTGTMIDAVRGVLNMTGSLFRASVGEPLVVLGLLRTIEAADQSEQLFIIPREDLRSLRGFTRGNPPGPTDDPDLQIPFHSGDSIEFELNSTECN